MCVCCVCVRLSINIYVMCGRHSCFLRRRATHTFRKQNFVSDADFVSSFDFYRVSRRLPCFHFCLSCFVFRVLFMLSAVAFSPLLVVVLSFCLSSS